MQAEVRLQDVDEVLRGRGVGLRFPSSVESAFQRDTNAHRRQHLARFGVLALLIYNLFLINDYVFRPEVFDIALAARLGLATCYGLLVILVVRRGVSPVLREGLMASAICVVMLASSLIFAATERPDAIVDPFAMSLILLSGNIFLVLRFWYAVGSTVIAVAIVLAFVIPYQGMSPDMKVFVFFVFLGTAAFTLIANYRLEWLERESYLQLLRETLRTRDTRLRNRDLAKLSLTDALTELPNRRHFDSMMEHAWGRAAEEGWALGLLIVDIDHFKPYNDYYGHLQGDRCLARVAAEIKQSTRAETDFVARYGGEEFLVLLSNTDLGSASATAERIRRRVSNLNIPNHCVEIDAVVTVSIGVSVFRPGEEPDFDAVFRRTDRGLYRAKDGGRNRVVLVQNPLSMETGS